MNKRFVSPTQVPPTAFFFFLWERTGALVLAWLRWCLGYKREGTCVHHLYKTHREGCWVLGGVMLTWVFATFKTHPEDFLCPALACYHAHFKDSIFSSLPIYATFFFKPSFRFTSYFLFRATFSLRQINVASSEPIVFCFISALIVYWISFITTFWVASLPLPSLISTLGSSCYMSQCQACRSESGGMMSCFCVVAWVSLWATCEDIVLNFLDPAQEQILYVD